MEENSVRDVFLLTEVKPPRAHTPTHTRALPPSQLSQLPSPAELLQPRPVRTAPHRTAPPLRSARPAFFSQLFPPRTDQKEVLDMASKTVEHLNLSKEQIAVLEDNFNKISKHPDGMTLMLIATECGLTEEETLVSTTDTHDEGWTSSSAGGNSDQLHIAEIKSRVCAFSRLRDNHFVARSNPL